MKKDEEQAEEEEDPEKKKRVWGGKQSVGGWEAGALNSLFALVSQFIILFAAPLQSSTYHDSSPVDSRGIICRAREACARCTRSLHSFRLLTRLVQCIKLQPLPAA